MKISFFPPFPFHLVRPWDPGSTRVWSPTSWCSCVHVSVPAPQGQSSPVLVGYQEGLTGSRWNGSVKLPTVQNRCPGRSRPCLGKHWVFLKWCYRTQEQEANWETGLQQGASRRDFKDKEEPAKLTEQANTDSCVKCRCREPDMF